MVRLVSVSWIHDGGYLCRGLRWLRQDRDVGCQTLIEWVRRLDLLHRGHLARVRPEHLHIDHGLGLHRRHVYLLQITRVTLLAVRMRSAGMGLVGAAVGLWATGLTAEYDVKPAVWYSELGVGGAFLLTGAVWSAVGTSRWNQNQVPKFHCANSEGIDCFSSHRMASSFFLGAGAAMVVGSTIGILVQRKYMQKRRTVMSPYFAGSGAGFMLQGRF